MVEVIVGPFVGAMAMFEQLTSEITKKIITHMQMLQPIKSYNKFFKCSSFGAVKKANHNFYKCWKLTIIVDDSCDVDTTAISGSFHPAIVYYTTTGIKKALDDGYFSIAVIGHILDSVAAVGKSADTFGPCVVGKLNTADCLVLHVYVPKVKSF